MPKELKEISTFVTGTITTPSSSDIPDDAASYSLNIDSVTQDGVLKGVPTDKTLQDSNPTDLSVNANELTVFDDDDKQKIVYHDPSDSKIKVISNIYDTSSAGSFTSSMAVSNLSSSGESVTGTPSFQKNNKEIHIGMGNGANNKPLWVGEIAHGQFGGNAPTGLQLEDAELVPPVTFSDMHKVVTHNQYIYGIEYGGQTLYKFKISGSTLHKTSKPIYKTQADLTGICLTSDGNIWLLDSSTYHESNNILGTLYKIDSTSLEIIQQNTLKIGSLIVNHKYTDILEVGAELYISTYKDVANDGKAYLCNFTIPTENGDITVTNRMPFIKAVTNNTEAGAFYTTTSDNNSYMTHFIPKVNLIKLKDSGGSDDVNYIGMAIDIRDRDGSLSLARYNQSSGVNINVSSCVIAINKSSSAGDLLTGSNKLFAFYAQGTVQRIFSYNNGVSNVHRGYITSDGSELIGISVFNDSDTDDSRIHRIDIADLNNNTGTTLSTYFRVINYDINEGAICVNQAGQYKDFEIFSSGNSVGRWLKLASVNQNADFNDDANITEITRLQSDAFVDLELTSAGVTSGFTGDNNYFYKISYMYDGYQESPLSSDFMITQSATPKQVAIDVQLYNTGSIRKRISHINIYMGEGGAGSNDPSGFYRLVKNIDINDSWVNFADDDTVPDWGVRKSHQFLHNGTIGANYEARTGISEVLYDFTPQYGLSSVLNNQLYISRCAHPQIDDCSRYLFKSRPYNYDQFNWISDFVVLESKPTALNSFMGRVYAFDEFNMYKIEPNTMYVEDSLKGIGALSQQSVLANDYGMCIADNQNIYLYDGNVPTPIGNSIQKGTYGWESRNKGTNPIVGFDASRKSFVIFHKNGNTNLAWVYNLDRKRWDLWETVAFKAMTHGKYGEMFMSDGTKIYSLYKGSGTRNWDWTSKKHYLGQHINDKMFKNILLTGTASGSLGSNINVKVNGSNVTETGTVSDFSIGSKKAGTKGKYVELVLTGQTGSIDAISLVYRRLRVK